MNGPTLSPCTHTTSVLPPTSSAPSASPSARIAATSIQRYGTTGASAIMPAISRRPPPITGWPGMRSYSLPPSSEPARYPRERATNRPLIWERLLRVFSASAGSVGPSEAEAMPRAMKAA